MIAFVSALSATEAARREESPRGYETTSTAEVAPLRHRARRATLLLRQRGARLAGEPVVPNLLKAQTEVDTGPDSRIRPADRKRASQTSAFRLERVRGGWCPLVPARCGGAPRP